MKAIYFTLLSLVISLPAMAAERIADHRITEVSVFPTTAIISRETRIDLPIGKHTIFFDEIPSGIPAQSLQLDANGSSELLLYGAELKARILKQSISEKREELEGKIRELDFQLAALKRETTRLEYEKKLVQGVSLEGPKSEKGPRSVKEIQELLALVSSGTQDRDKQIGALAKESVELNREKKFLQSQLAQLGPEQRSVSSIAVEVEAKTPFSGTLQVRHQTAHGQVRWTPSYRALIASDASEPSFTMQSYALVQQYTGEKWEDVSLKISTTEPHRGLRRPHIAPQFLDIFHRPSPVQRAKHGNWFGALSDVSVASKAPMKQELMMEGHAADVMIRERREMAAQTVFASFQNDAGPLVFEAPGKVTIESEGNTNRVPLSSAELDGEFLFVAVPSRSSTVYREMKVTNTLEYPLLPGAVDVFVDNAFIGTERGQMVRPEESFRLPIGEAQDLLVKRTIKKEYEDDSGLVRSFRRIRKDYEIELENLSGVERTVVVLEPRPISRHEKIEASITNVSLKSLNHKDEKRLENQEGILEWHVTVGKKDKQKIDYSTEVEFKSDLQVVGL